MSDNFVIIMAGGIGSRFWPASRTSRPKQFLDILGLGKTLIRLTFERFHNIIPASNIFVVTHKNYKNLVLSELPELNSNQVLCEPERKNTAPCVAYAAFKIRQLSANANIIVAPSDHLIIKEEAFLNKIKQGLDFVSSNQALLTLGIKPTHPNTGYGYIHFNQEKEENGFYPVICFTEKPDLPTAEKFLSDGTHLWNAGIFLWNVNTVLHAFEKYQPELYRSFESIIPDLNSDSEQESVEKVYAVIQSISIDYAIMEKADNIFTLSADIGWSDIGTWGALHEIAEKDESNNSILTTQSDNLILKNTSNCVIRTNNHGKLTILGGMKDMIVVDEKDVLMIYPMKGEQEIKNLLNDIDREFNGHYS
jgi:mannose-1-phosphate guanylyltransferase